MSIDEVTVAVRNLVDLISEGHYAEAIQMCSASRLSPADIEKAIHLYGKTFVRSPPDFFKLLDTVEIDASFPPAWSVQSPLWTVEEGRSDLTVYHGHVRAWTDLRPEMQSALQKAGMVDRRGNILRGK
ncbi:MAG TPA: hypothetical protein VGM97_17165 [Steroidobacteraceae bacterium]|jgi:hypothetical protein